MSGEYHMVLLINEVNGRDKAKVRVLSYTDYRNLS